MTLWKALVTTISSEKHAPSIGRRRKLDVHTFENEQRLVEGFIWGDQMILPRQCAIKDLSPLTAQVVVWEEKIKKTLLTGKLVLYSCPDRMEADCHVVGQAGKFLQLRFDSSFREPTRKYG